MLFAIEPLMAVISSAKQGKQLLQSIAPPVKPNIPRKKLLSNTSARTIESLSGVAHRLGLIKVFGTRLFIRTLPIWLLSPFYIPRIGCIRSQGSENFSQLCKNKILIYTIV